MTLPNRGELSLMLSPIRQHLNRLPNVNAMKACCIGERAYLALLHQIVWNGAPKPSRSGGWTLSAPTGAQFQCRLNHGFPLLVGKQMYWRGIAAELLFFLKGETNNKWLTDRKVNIWNEWAKPDGDLGPIYGAQWRGAWGPAANLLHSAGWNAVPLIDQLDDMLKRLAHDPYGRRHVVSAWNPDALDRMALPPCHVLWQVVCQPPSFGDADPIKVDLHLYQRSADVFLGVPFNIASYALLTKLIVEHLNTPGERPKFEVGSLTISFGDLHLYSNHIQAATQYVQQYADRDARGGTSWCEWDRPEHVARPDQPWLWELEDLLAGLRGYNPEPAIKAEVAV